MFLGTTTQSLEIKLGGAVTTNQLPWVADYVDVTTATCVSAGPYIADGATNSGTAVTMVAAPASGVTRQLLHLTVHNADTASVTITIQLNDNSTLRTGIKVTLATLENLSYEVGSGWKVIDASGNTKQAPGTITEANLSLSDNTTDDVTSTKHGFAPKSPADATKFLNGAATPAYALVKDSDLSTSDITTNDASTSKHGFMKKLPNDSTLFYNGVGSFAAPSGLDINALTAADIGLTDTVPEYNAAASANRKISITRTGGFVNPMLNDFRLTLQSGVAVSTADQTAKGTVYWTPRLNIGGTVAGSGRVAIYDGTRHNLYLSAELSLALTLTSGSVYDIFVYDNAGTLTLETLVWTNTTTRATAIDLQDGAFYKSGALTRRYLGTIYATATNQTEDSFLNRCVWNAYNQVERPLRFQSATASWTYGTATWRSANADNASRVTFVQGISQRVHAHLLVTGTCAAGSAGSAAFGLDRTNGVDATIYNEMNGAGELQPTAVYSGFPGLGYHFLQWVEYQRVNGGGNSTWYGSTTTVQGQAGIIGHIKG